jgi:hypothetical protein
LDGGSHTFCHHLEKTLTMGAKRVAKVWRHPFFLEKTKSVAATLFAKKRVASLKPQDIINL